MMPRKYFIHTLLFPLLIPLFLCTFSLAEQQLKVNAVIEKNSAYVGEPLRFQIQIEGSDSAEQPDLSNLTDFQVSYQGGQQNNSHSVTIINGKVTRVSSLAYVFNYTLTPKKEGRLEIPAIAVRIGSEQLRTEPVAIIARKPQETKDFKLRLKLEKDTAYVGEPVDMDVTWYIGKNVNGFDFNLPVLGDSRFAIAYPQTKIDPANSDRYIKIPLANREIIAAKGSEIYSGQNYMTVTFELTLLPQVEGVLQLPQASVACNALTGYSQQPERNPFDGLTRDDFFNDFFNRGRRQLYSKVITPSNEPRLKVKSLPESGRPDDFTGLIGSYSIAAQAEPLQVNVGDPITLTIMVTGPEYLENVELPPLDSLPSFTGSFKIPHEMAPGVLEDHAKIFTQTIRATSADVKQIPRVRLNFFNSDSGRYEFAESEPIAIEVNPTKIITARDAEGNALAPSRQEINLLDKGIAYNYEGLDILENQHEAGTIKFTSITVRMLLILPPLLTLFIFVLSRFLKKHNKDPKNMRARKAHSVFFRKVNILAGQRTSSSSINNELAGIFYEYLGDKLSLSPQVITYADVEPKLRQAGVGEKTLLALRDLMERLEETRYAGMQNEKAESSILLQQAKSITDELEQKLQ